MRRLILIKHSLPAIEPAVAPEKWRLGDEGKRRAEFLADVVADMKPSSLFASDEPKALETAGFIGSKTGLGVNIESGFKEHTRSNEPFGASERWRTAVIGAIRRPEELVYGSETTGQARLRFTEAVEAATGAAPAGDIAVVSHGTVISMFVAQLTGLDPVEIWSSLGLPGFVVVGWPDGDGIEMRWNHGEG